LVNLTSQDKLHILRTLITKVSVFFGHLSLSYYILGTT
jgi:hypothetical protein